MNRHNQGDNLKMLRSKQKLTLVYVADKLSDSTGKKIAYQNVQELERGTRKIPFDWLVPLSQIYKCTIDDLVRLKNE